MASVLRLSSHMSSNRVLSLTNPNKILSSLASLQLATRRSKSFNVSHPEMGVDYQHLTKSKMNTYHFQKSLPRLPLPKLIDTCLKYVEALKPLVDDKTLEQTKKHINEFLKADGLICQQSLEADIKLNKDTSYISKPWFDMYLSDRRPLPINYNPFLVFHNPDDDLYMRQVVRASNLVISSLRFYRSLTDELLEPEVYHMYPGRSNTPFFRKFTGMLPESISWYGAYMFKAYPLDMSQYENLFNTTRIPQEHKDYIKHTPGKKHIVIQRKGHFYTLDVLDKDGNIVRPDEIMDGIKQILKEENSPSDFPVGLLTTERRDVWAKARKHLEDIGNSETLDMIDTALFNLVLDVEKPTREPNDLTRLFLHSDGTNRWFDKSFSLIVAANGYAGINFEHSWGDGVAVLRYFNDIFVDSMDKPRVHYNTLITAKADVRKLEWNLDDEAKAAIVQARSNYNATCNSLEVHALDYRRYGRNICKPHFISPDAMMQLAFQMAHDTLKGEAVPTYESCSTAAFKHGRTETVRPCTVETQRVCKALRQPTAPSKSELLKMMKDCSNYHTKLIKEAAMGQGFDRHLFALRLKTKQFEMNSKIFDDYSYNHINHNILSTSTLSSDYLQVGAFGPVVPDGFGVGYSMWPEHLGALVTNYHGKADGRGFVAALKMSLERIFKILDR